jgi:hypothetical protein
MVVLTYLLCFSGKWNHVLQCQNFICVGKHGEYQPEHIVCPVLALTGTHEV